MNLQIFLALIAAIFITVAAYRYLKWVVICWLGGLFMVAASVALFLHFQNDDISLSIPAGEGLFWLGTRVSILGEYGWLSVIGLALGLVLLIAGIVKRIRMQPEPVAPVESKPLTEKEKIERELEERIKAVQDALGDPAKRGEQDAHAPGGAVPGRHAEIPEGFEVGAREQYQTLGDSFVLTVVVRLKAEIEEALRTLSTLKNTLVDKFYANKASADYHENATEPDPQFVDNLRAQVTKAGQQRNEFERSLNLAAGQQPDWDNPTSLRQLIVYGVIFALVEFGVSYYFLKDELGESRAITIALYAMTVIFVLAVSLAELFRFMRRPTPMVTRMLAGIAYAGLLALLFLGFGLLLEYREVESTFSAGFTEFLNAVVTGYGSMLTSLGNLTLFLINMLAFGLFYAKFLLWRERFRGYHRVNKNLDKFQEQWNAMFADNRESIVGALDQVSTEAAGNNRAATQAVKDMQEKKNVLENIQAIITPAFVQKLHPSYFDDVNKYRMSNKEHRNVQVNPAPAYFNAAAPFCQVAQHFMEDHGIGEFLSQHQDDISQANDTRQKIEDRAIGWHNERAQLNAQWAAEFKQKIDEAGQ